MYLLWDFEHVCIIKYISTVAQRLVGAFEGSYTICKMIEYLSKVDCGKLIN